MTVGLRDWGTHFRGSPHSLMITRSRCGGLKGVEQFGTIEKGAEESAPKE